MADRFKVQLDRFDGVTIYSSLQNFSSDTEFVRTLKDAIAYWKEKGKRGLWVNVQHSQASLIPLLTEMGLDFHHAQPGYVMMTLWMCEGQPNHLPEYANHYVGVAGFVVSDKGQVLVVKEKTIGTNMTSWKFPGGHADKGEDIPETARREVLEETGVESEFVSLIAFRHMHQYRYGLSDMYFVCLMRPVTTEIKQCPVEIAQCQWMDLDEYISDPDISDANRHFAQCYKTGWKQGQGAILPTRVSSGNKEILFNVYSISSPDTSL